MSYTSTRTAEGKAAPFLLFEFQLGDNNYYRYTDAEIAKSFRGSTWTPAAITPDFPGEDGQLNRQELTIQVQGDLAPGMILINRPPSFVCRVTVYDANHLDGNREGKIRFSGRIISAKWSDSGTIEMTVLPGSTELSLPGRPHLYQRSCPHVLYGTRCRATKRHREIVGTLGSDQILRTVGYPIDFISAESFSRGEILWTDPVTTQKERRTIARCEDNGGGLDIYAVYLPEGTTTFNIVMGCTHSESACRDWHSNINNFGGQPWIPLDDPHNKYTEFY